MKAKRFIIATILFIIIVSLSNIKYFPCYAKSKNNVVSEEKYTRTTQLLLYPTIQEEVQNRYGKYAYVDIYDINIKSISIKSPINITITAIIQPYTGPHNTISTDKVTLQIDSEHINIIDYSTLED